MISQESSNLEHTHIPDGLENNGTFEASNGYNGSAATTGVFTSNTWYVYDDVRGSGNSFRTKYTLTLPKDGDKESKPFNFTKILWKRTN